MVNHLKTEIMMKILQAKVVNSKHSFSVSKIDQLMLHRKLVVLVSEIRTEHVNKDELYSRLSPYRAVNTPRQGFKLSHLMLYGKESRLIPRYIQNI
jgi:hypothetical protein